MFKVYWTNAENKSCGQEFEDMTVALNVTQELRKTKCNKFITMSAENPDCTSLMGVADPAADYNWKKRRI